MRTWTRWSPPFVAIALPALLFVAACGGGDPTGPELPGGTGMTARVDGQSWVSHELGFAAVAGPSGLFTIVGAESADATSRTISLSVWNVRGPGTYALGMLPVMVGGTGLYSEGTNTVWSTPFSGAAGEVTLTTLTAERIAGTFQFEAALSSGSSGTQTRSITQGAFDMPLSTSGSLPTVPDDAGHLVAATLAGSPFNASGASATTSLMGDGLGFNANDLDYQIVVSLAGVTTAGDYTLDQAAGRLLIVTGMGAGSANCCWGAQAGDTGTITITSVSATRFSGTFSGTLQAQPGSAQTQPLVITGGSFDIGR